MCWGTLTWDYPLQLCCCWFSCNCCVKLLFRFEYEDFCDKVEFLISVESARLCLFRTWSSRNCWLVIFWAFKPFSAIIFLVLLLREPKGLPLFFPVFFGGCPSAWAFYSFALFLFSFWQSFKIFWMLNLFDPIFKFIPTVNSPNLAKLISLTSLCGISWALTLVISV